MKRPKSGIARDDREKQVLGLDEAVNVEIRVLELIVIVSYFGEDMIIDNRTGLGFIVNGFRN